LIAATVPQSPGCLDRLVRHRAQALDELVRDPLDPGKLAIDHLELAVPRRTLDVHEREHEAEVALRVERLLGRGRAFSLLRHD
jgi:hypothetical protein